MGAVSNAVALMADDSLLSMLKAVSVYVAREVIVEPSTTPSHDLRMRLAQQVIYNPSLYTTQFRDIIACDPDICSVAKSASEITDATLIEKMSEIWTPVSSMLYGSV
jgi:hypothetical protein